MGKFFKTGKAAKLLGVTKRTLERWIKGGIITPAKIVRNNYQNYNYFTEEQIAEFKKCDIDVIPLTQNSTGDSYKPMTFSEKCDKSATKPRQTASEQASGNVAVEKTRYLLPEIDTIVPEDFQDGAKTYDIGITAPLADNQKDEVSEEIGDTSTKVISVNIIPTTKLVMPNDKFCKYFFNFSQDEYEFILKNGGTIEECKKSKVGKIYSDFDVVLIDNYTSTVPLNMFDKSVVIACDSEFIAGNKFVTPAIIYRNMCGKNDGYNIEPPPEIRKAILDSVNKMMCTQITYDMSSACEHLKYNNGEKFKITATALPCKCVSGIAINGQEFETVIQLYDTSPFFSIACVKNKQLLTFNKHLLDVPKQRNTVTTISVKHYVLQRVLEIKLHNLKPVITFDDVFKKCNLTDADKMKKSRVRKEIISIMTSLQDIHDISSFAIKKNGNKYLGIEFFFPQSEFSAQSSKKAKKN